MVRGEHRDRMTSQRLEGPADLVIEIASEGDPQFDVREKLPSTVQCLRAILDS